MSGVKYDSNKLRYDLIPAEPLEELADVLSYGALKYGENNWQSLDKFDDRYYAALMRHIQAWRKGEQFDEESGKPHLSHALACVTFLVYNHVRKMKWKKLSKQTQ